MHGATTDCGAFDETVVFLSHFKDLQDPRQPGKVSYPLDEILLLCLLAVLAGAEAFTEIALFGVKKLELDGTATPSARVVRSGARVDGCILLIPAGARLLVGPSNERRPPCRHYVRG